MTNINFLKEKYKDFSINNFQVRLRTDGGIWVKCIDLELIEDDINNLYHRSDFRPIPDKEFEIGDWVVASYALDKPIQLTEDIICYYDGRNHYAQETHSNIWYPEEDDWVIYTDAIEDKFEVLRVKEFNKNRNRVYFGSENSNIFAYLNEVQPFIGNLPTKVNYNG